MVRRGNLGRLILVQGYFFLGGGRGTVVCKPEGFFGGFGFCPYSIISVTLNLKFPSLGPRLRTCVIIGALELNFPREYQTNLTVNNYFRADNRLFPWGANSCRMSQNKRLKLHKLHVTKNNIKEDEKYIG